MKLPTLLAGLSSLAAAAMANPTAVPDSLPPYRNPAIPLEDRVSDLLGRMTLAEKADQLHQSGIGDTNPNNLAARADEFRPTYGSYIIGGPPDTILATRNALQRRAVEESRLGIPALFGCDVIHGYRALTPIPLAQACAWDPELVRKGCAMAAAEARAHGVDWTFAPMVDHCIDPRWGRIAETFGESPYASAVFSAASVRGFQGDHPGSPGTIAACLKHYVGYGASEGGRDYAYTEISPQALWEMHLPSFEAGVRAGALSVMSAFNDLNGVPASANAWTLTTILRERWGFRGLVVSDWNSVLQLINQGHAANGTEAAALALNAGVDLDMADGLYRQHLPELLSSGRVSAATVDEAVRRVLRVKFALGLFEHPYAETTPLTGAAPNADQLALAEEMAARSLVLLKNDGLLPLAGTARRIAIVGALADLGGPLLGCWAQQGDWRETPSIATALRERLPAGTQVRVEPGCSIQGAPNDSLEPALAAAREADVVVMCVGEEGWMSGENASRSTLRLAGRQEELARAVAALGKPVVLVIVSGRPLDLGGFGERCGAILAAWSGGSRAAAAIADTLLGRRNPSGKLAVTWPRSAGQVPLYHNMRPRARTGDEGAYRDVPVTPLYEFGHGLSYSTFSYSPIRLDRAEVGPAGRVAAEVTVTNTGQREGRETVLWFIRDPAARVTRPLRDLKFFDQAVIAPGASHVFRWVIEPQRDFSYPDAEGRRLLDAGEIILMAGDQSARLQVLP